MVPGRHPDPRDWFRVKTVFPFPPYLSPISWLSYTVLVVRFRHTVLDVSCRLLVSVRNGSPPSRDGPQVPRVSSPPLRQCPSVGKRYDEGPKRCVGQGPDGRPYLWAVDCCVRWYRASDGWPVNPRLPRDFLYRGRCRIRRVLPERGSEIWTPSELSLSGSRKVGVPEAFTIGRMTVCDKGVGCCRKGDEKWSVEEGRSPKSYSYWKVPVAGSRVCG